MRRCNRKTNPSRPSFEADREADFDEEPPEKITPTDFAYQADTEEEEPAEQRRRLSGKQTPRPAEIPHIPLAATADPETPMAKGG